ncbi:MAG: TetR/AcrR family transcriptional regulator [Bacteroidales bacterium]|nr:TetR/AcrR family transcriptional regulator [Bacteroidales bacterium]
MPENEVKNLIIHAANGIFSKFGFHKTTMDEIAKHIHKAKGALYYYFNSKEDLFNEVLKQELNNVKFELNKIVYNNEDSIIALKKYVLTRLKLLNNSENYHETLKADFFERYYFVKDVRDDFDQFERKQLTLILQKGKDDGYLAIEDINTTLNIIMMVVNSIEIPLYLQNKYIEYEHSIDELSNLIIESLRYRK